MERARCRLCGHRHAGLDHIWDKPPPLPAYARYNKFDKKAYQREYMRKWRAAKKVAQSKAARK